MWIGYAGRALTVIAVLGALGAAGALYAGDRRGHLGFLRAGRAALLTSAAAVAAATGLLEAGLAGNDFHLAYVIAHSSLQTPLAFRLGALWGGQEGSLLFWTLLVAVYAVYLLRYPPREAAHLQSAALAVLSAILAAFALLVVIPASPFVIVHAVPDGTGLNRLLRNDSFLFHPVALYIGFVGFSVPFAYAVAGLLHGDTGDHWIRVTHRWALFAWAMLSAGILMGANWSYHVLGWGGYWNFDPVEDAALLPWLLGTAFIHSAMIQERRGMLKLWNVGLVAGTYLLTLFGTFLTRSGIVESVHTFAESPIGAWFLVYLGIAASVTVYLVGSRLEVLRDERRMDALVSKEGAFLLNNVVFLSLASTVLVGLIVPIVSPFFGQAVSVGPPYFERVSAPLFTVLLLLAGIGPLIAWRRAGGRESARQLLPPLLAAAAFALVLSTAGLRPPTVVVGLSCAFFAGAAVLYDFGLGVAARQRMEPSSVPAAAYMLVARNPRRYGGYAVHLAMAVIAFGVVASHAFQQQGLYQLHVGQSAEVGGYVFTYQGLGTDLSAGTAATYARVAVTQGQRAVTTLLPAQSVGTDAATAAGISYQVGISRGLLRDLYVLLAGYAPGGGTAGLQIYVNPLVSWIWLGGGLLLAGTLFSLWPRRAALVAPRSHRVFSLWSELEYDFRMGKTSEADYLVLRAQYSADAQAAMRGEGGAAGTRGAEALVARRAESMRATMPARRVEEPVGVAGDPGVGGP